jgi:hypothetical protein
VTLYGTVDGTRAWIFVLVKFYFFSEQFTPELQDPLYGLADI